MITDNQLQESRTKLFGRARQSILSTLYLNQDSEFHLRRIVRLTGLGLGTIQRELDNLLELGLIIKKTDGNMVKFQASTTGPIFKELRSIMLKTWGLADALRNSLESYMERIHLAFIYGSFANGTFIKSSDIDLMIVGDLTLREAVTALTKAEQALGREINPTVISRNEFETRIGISDNFFNSVWNGPRIDLVKADDA